MITILLVEDDDATCRALRRLLELRGYQVECAANGLEAVAVLGRCAPDVVVLDLHMPIMDGVAFLRTVRRTARWRQLPVILLTAMSDGPLLQTAMGLGVSRHFLKGSNYFRDLMECIALLRDGRELDASGRDGADGQDVGSL